MKRPEEDERTTHHNPEPINDACIPIPATPTETLKAMNDLIVTRKAKREALLAAGIDPYPRTFQRTHTVEELARESFRKLVEAGAELAVPGRVLAKRKHGRLTFIDIGVVLGDARIQAMIVPAEMDEVSRIVLENLDLGDWVGVNGLAFYTQVGQESIRARSLEMLTKALRPLPNFKGSEVRDAELLVRMPEVAMINGTKRRTLRQRSVILRTLRHLLEEEGYTEVETPILNPHFGGADARPFTTRVKALGLDVYLAVSPEIEAKRLVIGGLEEGVFTIARNFRNEGIDATHNPEFSAVEVYAPYCDYEAMMELTEHIFSACCIAIHGEPRCVYGKTLLDFTPPWPRLKVVEAVERAAGIAVSTVTVEAIREACRSRGLDEECKPDEMPRGALLNRLVRAGVEQPPVGWEELSDSVLRAAIKRHHLHVELDLAREWDFIVLGLFERFVEPTLTQPCHVILHPARSTVLCKKYRGGPLPNGHELVERFESYAIGCELSNAYTELNDPLLQRALVEEQAAARAAGNAEAMPHNEAFLESIEYGMPPCGGLGIGIDRMVMLLTDSMSIRDVIAFPLVKPATL